MNQKPLLILHHNAARERRGGCACARENDFGLT